MDVSLGNLYTRVFRFDANKDGQLSRKEAANAALTLKNEGDNTNASLMATFVLGGKNGTGLFPDDNSNGALGIDELALLAKAGQTGSSEDVRNNLISSDDFKAKFPDLYVDGGVDVDLSKLKDIANGADGTTGTAPTLGDKEESLSTVMKQALRFDTNRDGALSKQEIAQAVLNLSNSGNTKDAGLFATMLVGGNDGKGLFPDDNKDGKIAFSELANLAGKSGAKDILSADDYKAAFPDNYKEGGNDVDLNKIRQIAFGLPDPSSGGGLGDLLGGAGSNPLILILKLLLTQLLQRGQGGFGGGFGGGFPPPPPFGGGFGGGFPPPPPFGGGFGGGYGGGFGGGFPPPSPFGGGFGGGGFGFSGPAQAGGGALPWSIGGASLGGGGLGSNYYQFPGS